MTENKAESAQDNLTFYGLKPDCVENAITH